MCGSRAKDARGFEWSQEVSSRMFPPHMRQWLVVLVTLFFSLGSSTCTDRGREAVEITVPLAARAGSDQWAWAIAPYVQRHLSDSLPPSR